MQSNELAKKNTERLESQPMINELLNFFPIAIDKINSCYKFDLYHYKLLEVNIYILRSCAIAFQFPA
jgi:hypothetical protein